MILFDIRIGSEAYADIPTVEIEKKEKKKELIELASARTQEAAVRNCAVEHREPGVLAGLTDARVQWPAHRHERELHDRPPTPAR